MRTLKVAIAGKPPSAGLYSALAESAYKARNISEGDAAASKAVKLAPAAERTRVKKYLEELRKNPLAHVPVTVTKLPNGKYVATQAGKTVPVAPGPHGTFTRAVGAPNATTTTPAIAAAAAVGAAHTPAQTSAATTAAIAATQTKSAASADP